MIGPTSMFQRIRLLMGPYGFKVGLPRRQMRNQVR